MMLMMLQRCLGGDLKVSIVIDGAMCICKSDSALMLKNDDRFAREHCLVDVIEVSGFGSCSMHGETDTASELITVSGTRVRSITSIVLTLILIVLTAEYTPLSEMMLLHSELGDISIRRLN